MLVTKFKLEIEGKIPDRDYDVMIAEIALVCAKYGLSYEVELSKSIHHPFIDPVDSAGT